MSAAVELQFDLLPGPGDSVVTLEGLRAAWTAEARGAAFSRDRALDAIRSAATPAERECAHEKHREAALRLVAAFAELEQVEPRLAAARITTASQGGPE